MGAINKLAGRVLRKAARIVDPPEPIQTVQDEYFTWLCYANAGMLQKGNLYLMDYAIGHLPSDAPILEIGTFCGLSTNAMTHFKRKHGARNALITCDKWEFENVNGQPTIAGSPVRFDDYKAFSKESYLRNIGLFSQDDLPYTFEMKSDEFFEGWKSGKTCTDILGRSRPLGGPFSFCYIDGNHTYECAKQDFLHCDEYLEAGGFILFDDSTLPEFTLHELMPEVTALGRYRLVACNPFHLFQKRGSGRAGQ